MKSRKYKSLLTLALMLSLLCPSATTYAADESIKETELATYNTYITTDDSSEVIVQPYARGTYFNVGTATIQKYATGYVYCYATTTANQTVDALNVSITLQKYSNGSWSSVASSSNSLTDAFFVSDYFIQYVGSSGAYYRLYTSHYVYEGITIEYTYATTSAIYIN